MTNNISCRGSNDNEALLFLKRYMAKHIDDRKYANCLQQLVELHKICDLENLIFMLICNAHEVRRVVCEYECNWQVQGDFHATNNKATTRNEYNAANRNSNNFDSQKQLDRFYATFSAELIDVFRWHHKRKNTWSCRKEQQQQEEQCAGSGSENWQTVSVLEMLQRSDTNEESFPCNWYSSGCQSLDLLLPLQNSCNTHAVQANSICIKQCNKRNVSTESNSLLDKATNLFPMTNTNDCSLECGFRSGWVYEIYGEAGSGKTQLVLQILLQQRASDVGFIALTHFLTSQIRALREQSQRRSETNANSVHSLELLRSCAKFFCSSNSNYSRENCTGSNRMESSENEYDDLEYTSSACIYLVSEEIPVARLETLTIGAIKRTLHFFATHSELTKLPSALFSSLQMHLTRTLTVCEVLKALQIKPIASLKELHELFTSGVLNTALKLWGSGRGVVVIDSIANAVMRNNDMSDDDDNNDSSSNAESDDEDNMYERNQEVHKSTNRLEQEKKCRDGNRNEPMTNNVNRIQLKRQRRREVQWDLLEEFALTLKRWAVECNVCVLVTNQVRAIPTENILYNPFVLQQTKHAAETYSANIDDYSTTSNKYDHHELNTSKAHNDASVVPALSFTWASVPHARLLLRRDCNRMSFSFSSSNNNIINDNNIPYGDTTNRTSKFNRVECERQMILMHCPSLPPFQFFFSITNDGITNC